MPKFFTARLVQWRDGVAEAEIAAGAPSFMGLPDAWYGQPHWFCLNGHVSARYLKSEALGTSRCLACREPVVIGPNIGEGEFAPIAEQLRLRSAVA